MQPSRGILFLLTALLATSFFTSGARAENEVKYALAILHYNLQYVAGDRVIEDRIIVNSLDPMLDLFLKHENWGADFEMQGYMVEQTAVRYPEIFAKLKKLLDRGQVELMSFHYSDQLFLAYPRRDLEWSERVSRDVFSNLGIKRSGAVFTQEGQFGEGMADFMKDNGYSVLSLPKNLWRFLYGEREAAPYYDVRGVSVVVAGKGVEYNEGGVKVSTAWTYLNDAELLPTGGATPYSEEYFKPKAEAIAKYEAELASLEARGYRVGNMTQYIEDLKKAGVKPAKLPPVIDGDWQPADTMNIFRWMGDYHGAHERDNEVLTGNVKARHRLLAAETAIEFLKKQGKPIGDLEKKFFAATRDMMIAEVSDSTGWTPIPLEIEYSMTNAKKASDAAGEIIAEVKKQLGANVLKINTKTGAVEKLPAVPPQESLKETACPVAIELKGEIDKQEIKCFESGPGRWKLIVKFKSVRWHSNNFKLILPRTTDDIIYSPALIDDETVTIPVSTFTPERDELYLPCPNGLIGLGGGLFLIKKTDTVHVAFHFPVNEKTINAEMLKPANAVRTWEFEIVKGAPQEALAVAGEMNVHPTVIE